MYSDAELDAAVRAGVLTPAQARAFREFVAGGRTTPSVDEEHFRLLTGFNDIFVTIAIALTLGALTWLGMQVALWAGGALAAAASWGLAEYFTRRRRMALPSIVLLVAFVGSAFYVGVTAAAALRIATGPQDWNAASAIGAVLGVVAAYAHWRRFRVPITVAAGALAAVATAMLVLLVLWPALGAARLALVFAGGLGLFAFALWWDASDRERLTRRADVAFWLHLAAAPLIVHPVFRGLGLIGTDAPQPGHAALALALYAVLTVVALAVDRRALLVSALLYVIWALMALVRAAGSPGSALPLAALVIGSGLLTLSAFWHATRAALMRRLPAALQARLPPV
jgi:hypothetical protein